MVTKHYPPEFRVEAVALYRSRPGATIKSVADNLVVNRETLRNWIRTDDARSTTGPGAAASATVSPSSSAQDKNTALRKRIRELEEERDILRKAARYFAGQTRW